MEVRLRHTIPCKRSSRSECVGHVPLIIRTVEYSLCFSDGGGTGRGAAQDETWVLLCARCRIISEQYNSLWIVILSRRVRGADRIRWNGVSGYAGINIYVEIRCRRCVRPAGRQGTRFRPGVAA